ncbi:MAG: YjbH domain-containing protein, partial [Burkholderiales bacterium]|nr:YjbH domain-containing protein [Burkholderiales bacterium]
MIRVRGKAATLARALSFAALAIAAIPLHAQPPSKRLSDWLLEQPASPDAYPLGLSWRVPGEIAAQLALRRDLLQAIAASTEVDAQAAARLRDWLVALPVTGRVLVASADARWLQANPAHDPLIAPNDTVILPIRPRTVTVVTQSGERCSVPHRAGHEALAYAKACDPAHAGSADFAWIAQPDGRVQRFGVALWNAQEQAEPAPGAWIWAPSRKSGWREVVGEKLIRFLATQGPAPDPTPGAARAEPSLPQIPRARTTDGPRVTASDWGNAGLLQMPTARMRPAGDFSFTLSYTEPYTRGNVFVQPLDWLEAGFRYINVENRPYGDPSFASDQGYKDKGFDVKFRLWQESAYAPEVALGFRDFVGTGLFSGEYLVGSKRTGPFDWTLGVGWGYLAGRVDVRDPHTASQGQVGNFNFGAYFSGPAKLFGGVEYQTPWAPLSLKLEYDPNDFQHEPQANNQKFDSHWNFGLVYRLARWADLSVGLQRGNTLGASLALHTPLDQLWVPKVSDPPRVPVAAARPRQAGDWTKTAAEIRRQTGWTVTEFDVGRNELHVTLADARGEYVRERVDKAVAVLHRDAPPNVDRFVLSYVERGLTTAEHVIERDTWVAQHTQALPPHEKRATVIAQPPRGLGDAGPVYAAAAPRWDGGFGLDLDTSYGGPDAFVLYQLALLARGSLRLSADDRTWAQGAIKVGLVDNYDKFDYDAPSNLPRVRTDVRQYKTTSTVMMPNLQLTHVGRADENNFYSVYGGYLEEMYAGVGGEWLYRPFGSRIALGADVNAVQQRDYDQHFGLRDYQTVTGHGTLYWDTGWNGVQANISAGRYLAKDWGATLDVYREFKNGVRFGAFATKTNVSAEEFGEGSFDKGVYLRIPFDAMLTRSSTGVGNFVWRPLTRDGGAMLFRSVRLYGLTNPRDPRTLERGPAPRPNEELPPAERSERWQPPAEAPQPYTQVVAKAPAKAWRADPRFEQDLREALYRQGFRDIALGYDYTHRLDVTVSHEVLRPISLAVGRAARTALQLGPLEMREIRVSFVEGNAAVLRYDFADLYKLRRYYAGELAEADIEPTIAVEQLQRPRREANPIAELGNMQTLPAERSVGERLNDQPLFGRIKEDFAAAGQQ